MLSEEFAFIFCENLQSRREIVGTVIGRSHEYISVHVVEVTFVNSDSAINIISRYIDTLARRHTAYNDLVAFLIPRRRPITSN